MQTPKKFSSFSDQVSWISDEKGIKIKDREYAEEMLRQIGYFPLMGGYNYILLSDSDYCNHNSWFGWFLFLLL
jgi:abortive infection bacteriophage resistance protein